jgi:hypothetical protein
MTTEVSTWTRSWVNLSHHYNITRHSLQRDFFTELMRHVFLASSLIVIFQANFNIPGIFAVWIISSGFELVIMWGPFEKLLDWWQYTAVTQRETVTVMPSCSVGGNVVVAWSSFLYPSLEFELRCFKRTLFRMAKQLRGLFEKFVDSHSYSVYVFEKWVQRCKKSIAC